jgi:hypothetical protein
VHAVHGSPSIRAVHSDIDNSNSVWAWTPPWST